MISFCSENAQNTSLFATQVKNSSVGNLMSENVKKTCFTPHFLLHKSIGTFNHAFTEILNGNQNLQIKENFAKVLLKAMLFNICIVLASLARLAAATL